MMPFLIHYGGNNILFFAPLFFFLFGLALFIFLQRKKIICKIKNRKNLLGYSIHREVLRLCLFSFLIIGSFCMLMRPQWSKKEQTIPQQGRDLLLLLDISRSMRATDIQPNRLDAAKLKIKQLLRQFSCERVGLILFSGSAFVQCPLTKDFASLELFLDHVDIETISSGTTALDKALQLGIDLFSHMPDRQHKTMLVITDGEDFSANFEQIIEKSMQEHITICTLGVGTEQGAPIPIFNNQGQAIAVEKDQAGKIILTQLNTTFLQSISEKLHGIFTPIKTDASDIIALKNFFETIEKETIDTETLQQWEDQYHLIARLLFPIALLEWFL